MQDYSASPFHRFQGKSILVLFAVFVAYTLWYTGPGYFGQMRTMQGYSSLQEMGFYTGRTAVETLATLDSAGRKTKLLALIFDLPYMILQALVFEAFIAFGLRHIRPKNPKWNLLFILPILFLLADFFEDSLIALTLTTGSMILGSIAGLFTALKFAVFLPTIIVATVAGIWGLIAWRRTVKSS